MENGLMNGVWKRFGKAVMGSVVGGLLAVGMFFCAVGTAHATDPVTLPALGVDVAGTATAISTALGTVVGTLIAIFGAFLVVRLGMRWIRRTVN